MEFRKICSRTERRYFVMKEYEMRAKSCAEASPNIAFIKYWGKRSDPSAPLNWALNPSLSLTLSKARTRTLFGIGEGPLKSGILQGEAASPKDFAKIAAHVSRICSALKIDEPSSWHFESENNFPTAAGLASSASAFAALTWAVLGALKGEAWVLQELKQHPRRLSEMARWGSGSACRSVDGPYMLWKDEAASRVEIPMRLRDTIVILSKVKKNVPSSAGHHAALSSTLLAGRLERVPLRLSHLTQALQNRDLSAFGLLLEEEALEMHEVARHGNPPVDYLLPETVQVLEKIRSVKERDFYFTMDAGPNIHVISERNIKNDLNEILESLSIEAEIWEDESGTGPKYTTNSKEF